MVKKSIFNDQNTAAMRIFAFILFALLTVGLVVVLDRQLPAGGSKTPRLGYFLSPQYGFWQNAEPANESFDGDLKLTGLKGKVEVA